MRHVRRPRVDVARPRNGRPCAMLSRQTIPVNGWIDRFLVLFDDERVETRECGTALHGRIRQDEVRPRALDRRGDDRRDAVVHHQRSTARPHLPRHPAGDKGRGDVLLDGDAHAVEPGVVVFSLPGQMRGMASFDPAGRRVPVLHESVSVDTFSDPRFPRQVRVFFDRCVQAAHCGWAGASVEHSARSLLPCNASLRTLSGTRRVIARLALSDAGSAQPMVCRAIRRARR